MYVFNISVYTALSGYIFACDSRDIFQAPRTCVPTSHVSNDADGEEEKMDNRYLCLAIIEKQTNTSVEKFTLYL